MLLSEPSLHLQTNSPSGSFNSNLNVLKELQTKSIESRSNICNICFKKFESFRTMRIHQGHTHFKNLTKI